jgi:hypothetical protein
VDITVVFSIQAQPATIAVAKPASATWKILYFFILNTPLRFPALPFPFSTGSDPAAVPPDSKGFPPPGDAPSHNREIICLFPKRNKNCLCEKQLKKAPVRALNCAKGCISSAA